MSAIKVASIRPKFDNLLIQRLIPEQEGMIQRTDRDAKRNPMCKVLAVGPGEVTNRGVRLPMNTEVGDIVHVAVWSGTDFEDVVDEKGEKVKYLSVIKEEVVMANYGKLKDANCEEEAEGVEGNE